MDLLEYTNLFSPTEYKKNDIIILKHFQWWKFIAMIAINKENVKTLKCHKFKNKTLRLYIVCSKCGQDYRKIFKEQEGSEVLTIIGLINNIEGYQKIYNYVWRKYKSRVSIEKYRWNKKLFHWSHKTKWIDE